MDAISEIKDLIAIVHTLRQKFPNKSFTLDGRLVGDLGEILIEQNYNVVLFEKLEKKYDGKSGDKLVQIKTTFKKSITFPSELKNVPDYLIAIQLFDNGTFEELYNGPGLNIWDIVKNRTKAKRGYHLVSVSRLQKENKKVANNDKIICRCENIA